MKCLVQRRSDAEAFAVVIAKLKNGGMKACYCDTDRMIPAITSMRGWHPAPVEISADEIPEKVKAKIMKHLERKNLKPMED